MNRLNSRLAASMAALVLALAATSAPAIAKGRHGGHAGGHHGHGQRHWAPGLFLGGMIIGIGLGFNRGSSGYPEDVVGPSPAYRGRPRDQAMPTAPDPVISARSGQSPTQTEADYQDCNRWTMTQRGAMADATVFHRTALACMHGRGYTVR